MEILIGFLAAAIIAAVVLNQRRHGDKAVDANYGGLPDPEDTLEQELMVRVEEFIEHDQFSLAIQPMMDLEKNRVIGGEVLSRLAHPEKGVVFPGSFLPAIDEAGLYPKFDKYIFRKTCAWFSRSLAENEEIEVVSCNFSRKTLSEEMIAAELAQIADSYGLQHERLAIEITQREKETERGLFYSNLRKLKDSGFQIWLDDFGREIVSAEELRRYSLDMVKLDRLMLTAAEDDNGKEEYRNIITMAGKLGLGIIAEGIETDQQRSFVQEAGCRYGQGFLFYRPVSCEQNFEMIKKSRISDDWDEGGMR